MCGDACLFELWGVWDFKLISSVTKDAYFYALKLQMIDILAGFDSCSLVPKFLK